MARRASRISQQHFTATAGHASNLESEALQRLRRLSEQLCKDEGCVASLLDVSGRAVGCACGVWVIQWGQWGRRSS